MNNKILNPAIILVLFINGKHNTMYYDKSLNKQYRTNLPFLWVVT